MTVVTSLPRVSYNMHVTGESVEKPKKKKYDNYSVVSNKHGEMLMHNVTLTDLDSSCPRSLLKTTPTPPG